MKDDLGSSNLSAAIWFAMNRTANFVSRRDILPAERIRRGFSGLSLRTFTSI